MQGVLPEAVHTPCYININSNGESNYKYYIVWSIHAWMLYMCMGDVFIDYSPYMCNYIITHAITMNTVSGTCVLWTPWDQPKVSRLSRCPDFPGQFI